VKEVRGNEVTLETTSKIIVILRAQKAPAKQTCHRPLAHLAVSIVCCPFSEKRDLIIRLVFLIRAT
jgi:hypothetical protein